MEEDTDDDDSSIELRIEMTDRNRESSSSKRQAVMQQLLNDLLITNDWLEKEKTHPFSTLEVIIEEVTPCSSSQKLENNLSTIKAGLRTHRQDLEQDSGSDSEDEDLRPEMYYRNMLKKDVNYISDDSSISPPTIRTFNEGNTSKSNGESHKDFDRKKKNYKHSSDSFKEQKTETKSSNRQKQVNVDDLYRRYEQFIHDDARYIRRGKFSTLNRDYDRIRQYKTARKYYSATNLPKTEKENKPCKSKNNFICLNTYSVKHPPSKLNEYAQVMENRVHYLENQLKAAKVEKCMQKYETSSSDDDYQWRAQSFKDRGDISPSLSHKNHHKSKLPPKESPSFKNISYHEYYKNIGNVENLKLDDQMNDETNFITDTPDSGLQTQPSIQDIRHKENSKQASVAKDVSTQITDVDWEQICTTKKMMSERGYLRLNLPNSSDDEILEDTVRTQQKNNDVITPSTESLSSHLNSMNLSVDTSVHDTGCKCFPCSDFFKWISK